LSMGGVLSNESYSSYKTSDLLGPPINNEEIEKEEDNYEEQLEEDEQNEF
ncbi:22541_t:CDS:2, partial [Racocetra persica]